MSNDNGKTPYPDSSFDCHSMNRILRHRLRNLCAGVKMTIERIAATIGESHPRLVSRCDIIAGELDNLRDFTDRMDLLFDTLPPPQPKSLFELVTELRVNFPKSFPFANLSMSGPELMLNIRRGSWLLAALSELLNNAGEAAGDNGHVSLDWCFDNHTLAFKVSNNGTQFPANIPTSPPVPFTTDKSRHDGIGLAIAQRIANELNASLSITTSPDGVTASIQLHTTETDSA